VADDFIRAETLPGRKMHRRDGRIIREKRGPAAQDRRSR
jgi:hypothetical protein